MNSFANSLFTLLFGWARSLIQQLWTSASSGRYSALLSWLGDHWLGLAVFLCLVGTAADFLVWFVRWRPYLAWRTSFRRFFSSFQRIGRGDARRFARGYQGGVALDIARDQQEAPRDVWTEEAWREAEAPQAMEAPQAVEAPQMMEAPPVMETPLETQAAEMPVYRAPEEETGRRRRFAPAAAYEAPPMEWLGRAPTDYASAVPAKRRRRSEKYDRRIAEWRERLIKGDEDEEALLDSLPPVVDRQEAFHEPVYPQQSAQDTPYAGWRRPGGGNTDGQA